MPRDLARPAAWQHQHDGRIGGAPLRFLGIGPQQRDLFGERMADEGARGTAEPRVRVWLERQQSKHVVDIGAHRTGAAGPPRPDRGRHIVDDRDGGPRRPHPPRDPVGEVRAVDDDQHVRPYRDDALGRGADVAQDRGELARDRGEADDREVVGREKTRHPLRRHGAAADALEGDRHRRALPQGLDQRAGQAVPRLLPRDDEYLQWRAGALRRLLAHRVVSCDVTPTTMSPRWSASRTTWSACAMIVAPARTATPARPAAATRSTV